MKNYLVLYVPGMCGSWLAWLINQHKNFPQYDLGHNHWTNDLGETKTLDFGCFGADWYTYKHMTKDSFYLESELHDTTDLEEIKIRLTEMGLDSNVLNWSFEENRRIRPIDERNNESFTKDCVKILPNHGSFSVLENFGINFDKIDEELLKNIVDDMRPKKIIVPVFKSSNDTLVKRWIMRLTNEVGDSDGYYHKPVAWHQKAWSEWSEWVLQDNPYGNNVHYVDIEKLTSGDNDEYLKLCEAIDETPIPNIQEEITLYRSILLEVVAHYDRTRL